MRPTRIIIAHLILFFWSIAVADTAGEPSRYNVIRTSPSKDAGDSMPIGNGEIGLNVWVEPLGDLLFYIAKTDARDLQVTPELRAADVEVVSHMKGKI